jgi:hypothetical protein
MTEGEGRGYALGPSGSRLKVKKEESTVYICGQGGYVEAVRVLLNRDDALVFVEA